MQARVKRKKNSRVLIYFILFCGIREVIRLNVQSQAAYASPTADDGIDPLCAFVHFAFYRTVSPRVNRVRA